MEKSYILQIHTGSFLNAHTTFEKIKEKIDFMIKNKPVSAVIFGWNLDRKTNRELLCYFRQFSIPCYFWLPVLSEIDQIKSAVSITNYTGKVGESIQVIEDESFSFLCPNQEKNFLNICEVYEEYLSDLPFDGVFLDKIRFPSFANGYEEGFGCFCSECEKKYLKSQIDLPYLKTLLENQDEKLTMGHYDSYGHYQFDDFTVNLFYKTRKESITNLISRLCDFFHQKNWEVGLDIYAPFFAYHCGQDIFALSCKADFLKPMFYRFTTAPAGMQYEYDAYKQYFKNNDSFCFEPISLESLMTQIAFLKNTKCNVYPGIEVNPIEGICSTNLERFLENKDFFFKQFNQLVCCWNCLLMDDKIQENL